MDPLRALKLIARGKSFDESAVQSGIARKGAYQMDAYPEYDAAMSQVRDGGPAADAMFDDMIRFYAGDSSPVPVPASRKPVISEEVVYDRTFAPDRIQAKQAKGPGGTVRKPKAQEFKDDYMNQLIDDMQVNKTNVDDFDDIILAGALGSLLTGGLINKGNKEEEEPSEYQPR